MQKRPPIEQDAEPTRDMTGATQDTSGEQDRGLGFEHTLAPSAEPASAPPDARERALLLRRYRVMSEHARGGIGRVMRAFDERLGRTVAVKQLVSQSSSHDARFQREALISARLEHPNIVPVHDFGIDDWGNPFYVMKLVAGEPLGARLEGADFAARIALLPKLLAVAEAAAYAHSVGVVHRDLKPANILVGQYGETIVIDWGLAKQVGEAELDHGESWDGSVATPLTVVGRVLGTPAYMAPEQARGEDVGPPADVYALGSILYEILCGVAPYRGSSLDETLSAVRAGPPPDVGHVAKDAPVELKAIVRKAMAREPEARYRDAKALADDLQRFLDGRLVEAHAYGVGDRVWRWVRERKAAALSTLVTLVVITMSTALFLAKEQTLRHEAERQRDHAVALKRTLEEKNLELLTERGAHALGEGRHLSAARDLAEVLASGDRSARIMMPLDSALERLESLVWTAPLADTSGTVDLDLCEQKNLGIAASLNGRATLFELSTGRIVRVLDGHGEGLAKVQFAQSCELAVTFAYNGEAIVWRTADGAIVRRFAAREDATEQGALSPDGKWIVTSHPGAMLWDVASGALVKALDKTSKGLAAASFSDDGSRLMIANSERATVYSTRSFAVLFESEPRYATARLSRDGLRLVAPNGDGDIELFDVDTKERLGTTHVPDNSTTRLLSLSRDARFAAVVGGEPMAVVDLLRGLVVQRLSTESGGRVRAAEFSASSDTLFTADPGHLRRWDTRSWSAVRTLSPKSASAAVLSSDGALVAMGNNDGTIALYELGTNRQRWEKRPFDGSKTMSLAFSPDRKLLLVGSFEARQNRAVLFRVEDGTEQLSLPHVTTVMGVAFDPKGTRVATASWDGAVRMFDVASGRELGPTIRPQESGSAIDRRMNRVAFAPDGKTFAVGGYAGKVQLFDADSHERVWSTPKAHITVGALVFSPDGTRVASAGWDDATVLVWDARSGKLLATGRGHTARIWDLSFDESGRFLGSSALDSRARIWDAATGKQIWEVEGASHAARFLAGGRAFLTTGPLTLLHPLPFRTHTLDEARSLIERFSAPAQGWAAAPSGQSKRP